MPILYNERFHSRVLNQWVTKDCFRYRWVEESRRIIHKSITMWVRDEAT